MHQYFLSLPDLITKTWIETQRTDKIVISQVCIRLEKFSKVSQALSIDISQLISGCEINRIERMLFGRLSLTVSGVEVNELILEIMRYSNCVDFKNCTSWVVLLV
jgi:hypothetical protein